MVDRDCKRSSFQRFHHGESAPELEPDENARGRCPLDKQTCPATADVKHFPIARDVFGTLIPTDDDLRVPEPDAGRSALILWGLVLSLGRCAHGCSSRSRLRIWIRSGSRQQRRTPLIQNLVEFQADHPGIVVHSRVDHTAPYLFDLYPRATRHLERQQCVLTLE